MWAVVVEIDSVFGCGPEIAYVCVSVEIDLVLVWVIDIDLNSLWGIEFDLTSV